MRDRTPRNGLLVSLVAASLLGAGCLTSPSSPEQDGAGPPTTTAAQSRDRTGEGGAAGTGAAAAPLGNGEGEDPSGGVEESDAACSDRLDNDGDGFTDCEDRDCTVNPFIAVCPHAEVDCQNRLDDDADGFIDRSDWDCRNAEATDAVCSDGVDNDSDGYTDCEDFDCRYNRAVTVCPCDGNGCEGTDATCTDGMDNDGNGYTDCDDFGCSRSPHVTVCGGSPPPPPPPPPAGPENTDGLCADGLDNDSDGYTDCADYSCSRNPDVTVCPCDADSPLGRCEGGLVCRLGECVEEGVEVCDAAHPDGHCPAGRVCAGADGCLPPFLLPCSPEHPDGRCPAGEVCDAGACRPVGACSPEEPTGTCADPATACAAGECVPATPPAAGGELVITEVMPNPRLVNDAVGEWFEVFNATERPLLLDGLGILDNNPGAVVATVDRGPHVVPPGRHAVLGVNADPNTNGGIPVDVAYSGEFVRLGNNADFLRLVATVPAPPGGAPTPVILDEVSWGGALAAPNGASLSLDPAVLARDVLAVAALANDDPANWCLGAVPASANLGSDLGTPGRPNPPCGGANP